MPIWTNCGSICNWRIAFSGSAAASTNTSARWWSKLAGCSVAGCVRAGTHLNTMNRAGQAQREQIQAAPRFLYAPDAGNCPVSPGCACRPDYPGAVNGSPSPQTRNRSCPPLLASGRADIYVGRHHSKPVVPVDVVRIVMIARSGPRIVDLIDERTAAQHTALLSR